MSEEMLDILNPDTGEVIGIAPRKQCHGDNTLWHRAVHVLVFHPVTSDILLQKRAENKLIQPGKWDSSVGGHVSAGETIGEALLRETEEEIGLKPDMTSFVHLFDYRIHNELESELVTVYRMESIGPFAFPADEIDELNFFPQAELIRRLKADDCADLTPVLQRELAMLFGIAQ